MSYLVDSDWLIDAVVGRPRAVALLAGLRGEGLAFSIISCGELFEGSIGAPDPEAERDKFRRLLTPLRLLRLNESIMEIFARTHSDLRRSGLLIADLDLLIAATALHHDLTLVTRNVRLFTRVLGLRLYQAA